jgi:hypothetical protein
MLLAQTTTVPDGAWGFFAGFFVIGLLFAAAMIVAWVQILRKAGYSGWWVLAAALLALVPFIGPFLSLALFFVFAFSRWPVVERADRILVPSYNHIGGYSPPGMPPGMGPMGRPSGWVGPPPPPPAPPAPPDAPQ